MSTPETVGHLPYDDAWFKRCSLDALRASLCEQSYPGYPTMQERLSLPGNKLPSEHLQLPDGSWETSGGLTPGPEESLGYINQGLRTDTSGRPLHPWAHEMLADSKIGVVTGKGFYWNWGPNYTADPIIIRHDLSEPHILIIKRSDTGHWALPGGFRNKGEAGSDAALREGAEESGIFVTKLKHTIKPVYSGPLADLRVTANAWPETAAFCIDLCLDSKQELKMLHEMMSANRRQKFIRSLGSMAFKKCIDLMPWEGQDDAVAAKWIPASQANSQLFGSHRLLIELALR